MLDMANFAESRIRPHRVRWLVAALEAIFEQTQLRDLAFDGVRPDRLERARRAGRSASMLHFGTRLAGLPSLTYFRGGARIALPDIIDGAADLAAALGITVLALDGLPNSRPGR